MAERIVKKAYPFIFAALLVFALICVFTYRLDITGSAVSDGYVMAEIQSRSYQSLDNENVVFVHIENVSEGGSHLIFYTIHQNVSVYWGSDRIYSMKPAKGNAFTKTPGCVWNDILLTEEMNGEDLEITLSPVYKTIKSRRPDFYLGDKVNIVGSIVRRELFALIVSVLLMVVGIAIVGYVLYNRKNQEVDANLKWLGIFAGFVGLWRVTDSSATKLLFHGFPVFSLVPFIAILLCVIPFLVYCSEMFTMRDDGRWTIPGVLSIGTVYLSLFLQYFNILDMRQLLFWDFFVMVFTIGFVVYMGILEYRHHGFGEKLRKNLLGMALISIGFLMDVAAYIINGGRHTPGFCIFGFLLYILSHGISLFRKSGALIIAGEGVQKMEDLAFHDKLTGLFNRAAFITDTDPYAVDPSKYAVVVMDLNNLKKCNDTLGHEMGDKYICDSARIIQETFGSIGSCYRMGGDEFYCLIPEGGKAACQEQEKRMEKMVEEYNMASPVLKISIACGYARYDNRMDYDLNATAKRADKLMYQRKEEMKGHKK